MCVYSLFHTSLIPLTSVLFVGIPVVPGMNDATTNLEEVERFASELGFPVILKAVYGGGGIGLCVAHKIEVFVMIEYLVDHCNEFL